MQATQHAPATTFPTPRLGKAAVVAIAAALLGGLLATQGPWAVTGGDAALSAADGNAALIQVRAGERESLGLGEAADVNAALVQVRAGERESLGLGQPADADDLGRNPGSRGIFPR